MVENFSIKIEQGEQGQRLDVVLAQKLPEFSRTRLKSLIEQGQILINGEKTTPSLTVKADMLIVGSIPDALEPLPCAQEIPLNILYEDEDLLVINKNAGMVVHPAPGHYENTLVNALLAHCGSSLSGIGGVKRPGLVHRLDKGTSGLMVVAKNDKAHRGLALQFAHRSLKRTYQAIVWGLPLPLEGSVETLIGRCPTDWRKRAVLSHGGKTALTDYKVIQPYAMLASLVECRLHTGRTHQIRVHMTHKGFPLIGDPQYGKPPRGIGKPLLENLYQLTGNFTRPCLHAYRLEFYHPVTSHFLEFKTGMPEDMQKIIVALEGAL